MTQRRHLRQGTMVAMWVGIALFNGAAVWAGDSGSAGTTQRFRGTVQGQGAVPEVIAKQAAPGTSLLFAAPAVSSDVAKEVTLGAGSTMRFASPISGGADRSARHGMVDVKEDGGAKGTFN
ncbi:MAG TPA: hypothetical protein VLA99_13355 [Nitrospiraceae bacterium]|nr:hypothetical protein [Nitrospiraceae bacterium]